MKKLLTILFFISSLSAYSQVTWVAHNDSLFIKKGDDSVYYSQYMFFDFIIGLKATILSAQGTLNAKQDAITTGTTAQYFRGDLSLATLPTTTAPFSNSTDKNFVTDAKLAVVNNTTGTNSGDNSANTTYASDYRAANFVAGTNYLAPNGSAAALTSFPTLNQNTTGTAGGLSANIAESQVTNLVSDLALKAPLASPTFTGTVAGVTATMVGLGNVTNESKGTMFTNPAFTGTPTGIGIPVYARVTGSNVTTTGQSLVNITGLSIALAINATYEFEAVLSVSTSAVTTGTAYGVNYSAAGATVESHITGASTSTATKTLRINALNTATTLYLATSAQTGGILIKGIMTTGANAGNLTISHLKLTSGTSTVFINSYLKAVRIL